MVDKPAFDILSPPVNDKPDQLEAVPIIGPHAALIGLAQWRDNHGNSLSGDNLECSSEPVPVDLSFREAVGLHGEVFEIRFKDLKHKLHTDLKGFFLDLFLLRGKQELGELESPLFTACKKHHKEKSSDSQSRQ